MGIDVEGVATSLIYTAIKAFIGIKFDAKFVMDTTFGTFTAIRWAVEKPQATWPPTSADSAPCWGFSSEPA
ncbi:hypothetical protein ACWCPK_38225 [Streptomyces sp. NPDC001953]